jgi:hypothetical protein
MLDNALTISANKQSNHYFDFDFDFFFFIVYYEPFFWKSLSLHLKKCAPSIRYALLLCTFALCLGSRGICTQVHLEHLMTLQNHLSNRLMICILKSLYK